MKFSTDFENEVSFLSEMATFIEITIHSSDDRKWASDFRRFCELLRNPVLRIPCRKFTNHVIKSYLGTEHNSMKLIFIGLFPSSSIQPQLLD